MSYEIGYIINMETVGEYQAVAEWCNETQKATIEQQGDNYVVVAIPEPTQEELNAKKVEEIDAELTYLDGKSERATSAITLAQAKGETPNQEDVDVLTQIELRRIELRAERATLVPSPVQNTLSIEPLTLDVA